MHIPKKKTRCSAQHADPILHAFDVGSHSTISPGLRPGWGYLPLSLAGGSGRRQVGIAGS